MTPTLNQPPLFQEVQQFRQKWLWLVLLGVNGLVVTMTAYSFTRSSPDASPLWVLFLVMGISIANVVLFTQLRLITEVHENGILIHYRPLKRRWIPREQLRACEARTYRPIRDYGGWGIRRGWGSVAYTVRGNQGVWVELTNGRPVMIGSQQADSLAAAIATLLPPP